MRKLFTTHTSKSGKSKVVEDEQGKEKEKENKGGPWKRKKEEEDKGEDDIFAGLRMRGWAMGVLIMVVIVVVMGLKVVEGLWVGFWGLVV